MSSEFGFEWLFIAVAVIALLATIVLHASNWLFRSAGVFAAEGLVSVFGRTSLVVGCGAIFMRFSIETWEYLSQPRPEIFHAAINAMPALIALMLLFRSTLALGIIVYADAFGSNEAPRRQAPTRR